MTKFRDDYPGKQWCEHCNDALAKHSVQIPDLGRTLSGNFETIEVCDECDKYIRNIYEELLEND
jgi:uncharacterized protein with PIN domain